MCHEQSTQLLHFPHPFLWHTTGNAPVPWWEKDQDVWKGAYQAQAAVTARLVSIVLPERFRKTSQTNCPQRTHRQPVISLLAKAGEFFHSFSLSTSFTALADRTQQNPFLWWTGDTLISYYQRHTRHNILMYLHSATSASKSTGNFFPQWKSNFYRM